MGTQTNKQPNSSQLQDNESRSSQPQQLHTHNHHKAAQRNIFEMGAVVSCIKSLFQTIGACIMAVVNGIAGMLKAIVNEPCLSTPIPLGIKPSQHASPPQISRILSPLPTRFGSSKRK